MDYSQITDELYIGTTPGRGDYEVLRRLGIELVINMLVLGGRPPDGAQHALGYMRLPTFDIPFLPIPTAALMRGTRAALDVIRSGGKVYAHCSRGRHRSVAMAAAILIARGLSPEEAMALIKGRRAAADPEARHIRPRILEFARCWSDQRRQDGGSAG